VAAEEPSEAEVPVLMQEECRDGIGQVKVEEVFWAHFDVHPAAWEAVMLQISSIRQTWRLIEAEQTLLS
jgi:hypothetical protein